jgi:predicted dienelactone hydrolase
LNECNHLAARLVAVNAKHSLLLIIQMKIIDIVFLVAIVIVASYLMIKPKQVINRVLKAFVVFIILLAPLPFLIEGYYWQYVPSYLLLLILTLRIFVFKNIKYRILFQFVLVFFIVASIAPWAIFNPIPKLTTPQGKYSVGTRIFRWVDSGRAETITTEPNDKRNVIVQAWYPAEENAKGIHSEYIDGMDNLPDKIGILPRWIFTHYDQIDTHGILNAPILKAKEKWPVVIFLTGNVSSRAFYTSLVTGLASRGYAVLIMDHPYEAMVTQLADGSVVTTIENYSSNEPNLLKFMERRLDLRIEDVGFVLGQLASAEGHGDEFLTSLDQNRIVIAGHSLGGVTAAVAMTRDPRIKAAVNIDGTLYGQLPESKTVRPFLLVESKKNDSIRFQRYESGSQQLFTHFGGGYRYEISEADHYSFTDAPLLLALPARVLTGRFLEFGNIPAKTHTATVGMMDAFFSGVLDGTFNFVNWCQQNQIQINYIQPGKPVQNAYIERFNGSYRREVLDRYAFETLEQVRETTYQWMVHYNYERPHDALFDLSPNEFALKCGKPLLNETVLGFPHFNTNDYNNE